MRIFRKTLISMETGEILAAVPVDYSGPVAYLKGGSSPPPPPVWEPPEDEEAIKQAQLEARREARRRAGRSSTILTSGLGATTAPGARKTLFGQ